MESPLSQLASGWQESPRMPRRLPTVGSFPVVLYSTHRVTATIAGSFLPECRHGRHPGQGKIFDRGKFIQVPILFKELPQRRDSPEARHMYRSSSPDPFRYGSGSRHSSEVVPHFKELPSEWRRSPEIRQAERAVSQEASPRRPDPHSRHGSNTIDGTYYIVPPGVDVIFQDEEGNEITRVGDFKNEPRAGDRRRGETSHRSSSRPYDEEEIGHERSGRRHPRSKSAEIRSSDFSDSGRSRSNLPTIILIDRRGRQIPIMPFDFDRRSE
ncbi:hypothetical protein C8R45DRAFT_227509 [Mycena sanguinolenta]|nr:hypothetical protein C8R45DRAFT_227509 [Mycena sanguinolenta]